MTNATRRTLLLKAEELRTLGSTRTGADETDLDELARIALLVRISGGDSLDELSEDELDVIFDELLSGEDHAVIERLAKAISD